MVGCGSIRHISRQGAALTYIISTKVTPRTMSTVVLTKLLPLTGTSCSKCLSSPNAVQVRGLADSKEVKENVEKFRRGESDSVRSPEDLPHFRQLPMTTPSGKLASDAANKNLSSDGKKKMPPIGTYVLPHPIWTEDQVNEVKVTHKEPESFADKMAFLTVKLFRGGFDLFSGFKFGQRNEKKWLNRICFLETVAGVPGMVAAMMRHMTSLRRLQRDQGWIHTLLEEAENERMHLLTALQLKEPSLLFRLAVIGAQGVFVTMFGISYVINAKFCHRFVGYLEEEAVKTYTKCLEDIDQPDGPMKHWQTQAAPDVAIRYWKMKPEATMRDVILAIRADEAHHRIVNHSLASLRKDEFNPHKPGE